MKAACIQMITSLCSKQENVKRALSLAEDAVSKDAELLVFPEVFSTGFCYDHIQEVAESSSGPTLQALRDFSKEYNCTLAGSMIERKEDSEIEGQNVPPQYNLGFCIESGKLVGRHRKTHLYGLENDYFSHGDKICPIRLEKQELSIGLIVCNELRYPEVSRKLALEGADILVSTAEIPDFFGHSWKILSLARAVENEILHIACTGAGKDRYATYFGGSFIADGWGRVLAEAGREECVLLGEIDIEEAKEMKKSTTIFAGLRPELY